MHPYGGGAEIGINGGGRDDEMNAATIATDAVRVIQSRRGLQVASVARYQVTKYVVEEVFTTKNLFDKDG